MQADDGKNCHPAMPAAVTSMPEPDFVSRQVREARRYYLNLGPAGPRTDLVRCGGCEHCEPDYRVDRPKGFQFHCVELVAQGEGTVRLGKTEFRLRPGVVFSYGPGVPHWIRSAAKAPMVKYYVNFDGPIAQKLLARGPLGNGKAVQMPDLRQVVELFELLQRNGSGDNPLRHPICASLLESLLLTIESQAIPVADFETRALATYQRARSHLEQNFARLRTLEEAAAETHINVSYLCRLFQRFDRQSPYQYMTRLKMNRAAELLLVSGMLVKQVAEAVGFGDPYHFSRAFKSAVGLSPEKFAKGERGRGAAAGRS